MIQVTQVKKIINGRIILDSISLHCEKGVVYALLGPNGVGKTTLLRCILGVYSIQGGQLFLQGERVFEHTFKLSSSIGVFLEDAKMYPTITIAENLSYFATFYNKGLSDEQLHELLKSLGLIPFMQMKYSALSSGNKRKCNLVRSLLGDPELIIWDEPFATLDPESVMSIRNLLFSLKEKGKTIFITSNDLHNIELVYDKVGFFYTNSMLLEYTMKELQDSYQGMSLEEMYFILKPKEFCL